MALAAAPTPPFETSPEAAVAVVRHYYAALDAHDYRTAWRLWSGGQRYGAFRRGYARTAWTRVTPVPPFAADGAAGSIYSQVRVRVDAALIDGTRQRFVGSYTLRRVNDVEGSTPDQRRWHIEAANLKAVPAGR